MIRLSVFYPKTEGTTFDYDYFRDKHLPLGLNTFGVATAEIDRGVDGPYVAATHVVFESLEAMNAAMSAPGAEALQADVANYTTITPVMQVSEILS